MAYTQNEKSTGLDVLTDSTLTQSDLHIVGDVSDSGRAKTITQDLLEDYIANSSNFITELVANSSFLTALATIINNNGVSSTTRQISQTAHGFSVGDIVRSSGTAGQFTKALADTNAHAQAVGIVTVVTDANTFTLTTEGFITTGVPAATAGTVYYLSSSVAGAVTSTEPTISKPLIIVITSGSLGYFHNSRLVATSTVNYTVNADETITDWLTMQILAPFLGGTNETPWTFSGTFASQAQKANGAVLTSATAAEAHYALSPLFIVASGGNSGTQLFGTTFNSRLKFVSSIIPGLSTSGLNTELDQFIGFSDGVAAPSDITSTTNKRVGFVTYNGVLYAVVCNGSAITATSLGSYTSEVLNLYEIVITGTTNVKFYINGSLVATITTNLPTNGAVNLLAYALCGAATSTTPSGFNFISNFVFAQKLS